MSEPCSDCGYQTPGCHYSTCARLAQAVAQQKLQPTAYDRAQAELARRIEALEQMQLNMAGNVSASLDSLGAQAQHLGSLAQMLSSRTIELGRANKRIEALEAEVAKLKAWSRPPELMCMICGTGFATDAHKTNHRCGRGAL